MDIIIMMKKDIDYMKNNISFLILFSLLFYSSILCANENSNLQVLMKHGKLKS